MQVKTNTHYTMVLKDVQHVPNRWLNLIVVTAFDRQGYDRYFNNGTRKLQGAMITTRCNDSYFNNGTWKLQGAIYYTTRYTTITGDVHS